jgi:hypothetical protein
LCIILQKLVFILILIFGFIDEIYAQCTPSYNGILCVDNPIQFDGNSPGATFFNWNFNNEGSNNTTIRPVFTFNVPGLKTVQYSCRLANGDTCSGQINFTVKAKPKIQIRLLNDSIQCFENNVFCFKDSSISGDNNSCIISIKYLFSDGELITKYGTKFSPISLPATVCKSIYDPQGLNVNLIIEIEDCNGCISRYNYPYALKTDFSPSLFANYKISNNPCLGSANTMFYNTSQINRSDVQSFEWDFGDGNKNNVNWDSVPHTYLISDSLKRTFYPTFKVVSKIGCVKIFNLSKVQLYNLKPSIYISRDSFCSGDTFEYKILPESMKEYITTRDIRWNFNPGISNEFSGIYSYGSLGPKKINCTISHPCGPFNLSDTLIVIGPVSLIEPDYLIDPNQRFQCVIRDSVKFYDQSLFYHNDKNMLDDDSLFRKTAGNLGHHFTNNLSTNYVQFKRENNNVIRLWDFGDNYCEQCTTDSKNNRNTWVNCRYSRDKNPQHWFTPWDSIYDFLYSHQSFEISGFDVASKTCQKIKIFASDSLYLLTDTVFIYGDNWLGNKSKDSSIYKGLRTLKIPEGILGKGKIDAPYNLLIFIQNFDTVFIDRKNGFAPFEIRGPSFFNVLKNDEIIISSSTDTCWFVHGLKINQDTLPFHVKKTYHHIVSKIKNPMIKIGDIVNPDRHRQLFYDKIPACFDFTLYQKDFVHPLKCESQQTKSLSLLPPSAKKLRITDQYCYDYDNKIVEFGLSDTKPGCSQALAEINFDYIKDPNKFELINNLYYGDLKLNKFINSSDPYKGYSLVGPFNNTFYHKYSDKDLDSSNVQKINVAIIIGNGNNKQFCNDTIYYPNLISFPRLNTHFDILGRKKDKVMHVCPNESICIYVPKEDFKANKFADKSAWSLIEFNRLDTIQRIIETYHKLKTSNRYPNQLVNYTTIERFEKSKLIKKDTIFTAIVHKYHTKLLNSVNNNRLKEKLNDLGFNFDDLEDSLIIPMIWNGLGTIGDLSSGSKGCLDTLGFGSQLKFEIFHDSVTYLSFKDTSLLPLDISNYNGVNYQSYCFKTNKSGPYKILREIESYYPSYCPKYSEQKVVVGYSSDITFSDSIFCIGKPIIATTFFRYYSAVDSTFGSLDSVDYWKIREQDAGKPGFEGRTYWDFSQQDDDPSNPNTIFGIMPYTRVGLGNPNITLGNEPGGIYYNSPGFYTLRTLSSDSNRCMDTFKHNLYILGPKAGFLVDYKAPNCKTIVELFDTSKIIDPCVIRGLAPCDNINYWKINWGDGSPIDEYIKNRPLQIGHDYNRNGNYRIWFIIKTVQGCEDSVYQDIFIPGPQPRFRVETNMTICVNDSVKFKNTSINSTPSASWLWNYGDDIFEPQKDTNFITHQYTKTGEFYVYLTQFDSIANTGKYCSETYPDTFNKIKITVRPYDVYQLKATPQIVCVGDSLNIEANITSFNNYNQYHWQLNQENKVLSNQLNKFFTLNRTGSHWIYFKPDTFGLNRLTCPSIDSIEVFADSVVANFEIDSTQMPLYCFNNTSQYAQTYRWGFFHEQDIQNTTLTFLENAQQQEPEKQICQNFNKHPGTYWICLEATNSLGCKDTICKKIINNFERIITPPNVFTPSGKDGFSGKDKDGLEGNNVFNIYIKGEEYYDLVIYDRWGVKVFESKDKTYDWNGYLMNKDQKCTDGTYYYILKYRFKDEDKNEKILNGVVRLIWEN